MSDMNVKMSKERMYKKLAMNNAATLKKATAQTTSKQELKRAISAAKAAQTRAKKLIEKYQKLGWTIKPSVIDRVNMEIPKNISLKKAQAIADNLSASTIRTTMTISTRLRLETTEPIVMGEYKSGAKKYDVIHMNEPDVTLKDVEFSQRDLVRRTMDQIKFVLKNAPSAKVADEIETKLFAIELHGTKIFTEEDRKKRQKALLESIESEQAIKDSIKKAEENKYPATVALLSLYQDLASTYGTDEKGIAAYRLRQHQAALEATGNRIGDNPKETQSVIDVVTWLIEHDDIWQSYRRRFHLKKIHKEYYDSDSLLTDVTETLVENPEYKIKLLNYLIDLMSKNTDPGEILKRMETYVEELKNEED